MDLNAPGRSITENFLASLDVALRIDGQVREFYIQSGEGKGIFKKLEIFCLWYRDTTAPKALLGQSITISCDAILVAKAAAFPRRPLANELIHHPRNTPWLIVESSDVREFYQLGLNRAGTS